jgi:hypothetical protein
MCMCSVCVFTFVCLRLCVSVRALVAVLFVFAHTTACVYEQLLSLYNVKVVLTAYVVIYFYSFR